MKKLILAAFVIMILLAVALPALAAIGAGGGGELAARALNVFGKTSLAAQAPADETYAEAFPDANFRQAVLDYLNGLDSGARTAVSLLGEADQALLAAETFLDITEKGIADLTGIAYFSELTGLRAGGNLLTSVDLSKNTKLWQLGCSGNQLKTLNLTQNTALVQLFCNGNGMTSLDVSQCRALTMLACYSNELPALDVSKNTALEYLQCDDNPLGTLNVANNTQLETLYCTSLGLKTLDVTNNKQLIELFCGNNELTSLNLTQNSELLRFSCDGNQIAALNVAANTKLIFLHCGVNLLQTLDVTKNSALTELAVHGNQLETLDISQNINLLYYYCYSNKLTALNITDAVKLVNIHCGYNQLQSLEVGKCTELVSLNCGGNQLQELNLANNTKLTNLFCSSNKLAKLSLPAAGSLINIECASNELATLDVGGSLTLKELNCNDNKLQQLDLTKNSALTSLACWQNGLSALDVSKNTALLSLYCAYNQLTALDVSASTQLYELYCDNNLLETVNIAQNTELTSLNISVNKLRALNLTNNIKLRDLRCADNLLTGLNVSQNTALEYLYCSDNPLAALNLANNTKLETLFCNANGLTELNLSNNTELTNVRCTHNKLTALDVSKNSKLVTLWCHNNQLHSLNVSGAAALEDLWCYDNLLTSLNVSANKELKYLWCMTNMLTSLDVSQNTLLESLWCNANYMNTPASVTGWNSNDKLILNSPDDTEHGTFLFYNQINSPTVIIINQPPSYIVVNEGASGASLSVTALAAPSGVPTYQWYSNTAPFSYGGTAVPGATAASLAIPASLSEAGSPYYYYCLISAPDAQSVTTVVSTVTVMAPPKPAITITRHPSPYVTVTEGLISGVLSLEAIVTPAAEPSYQWYSNTEASSSGGSAIAGANGASFAIPASLTKGTYYYYCLVSAPQARTIASVVTAVFVVDPLQPGITLTRQPADATAVVEGQISGSLYVEAVVMPSGTPTYQWYSNTAALNSGGTPLDGASGGSLLIPRALSSGTYYYYCLVSATGEESVASKVATVTVYKYALFIEAQPPAEITVTEGSITGALLVGLMPVIPPDTQYQWYSNSVPLNIGGTPLEGATGPSFTLPSTLMAAGSPYYYYCVVSAPQAQSVVSRLTKVTVESATAAPLITITTQPQDTIADVVDGVLTSGGVLTIAASVTPSGTPAYTWYRRLGASPDPATDTQVGTGASYTVPAISTPVDYYYYCVVSAEGALSVISAVAKVTVNEDINWPGLDIITQPAAETTVTEGAISGSLFVEVKAYGYAVANYQWYSNTVATNSGGTLIPGAVSATFNIPADLKATGSPYYYYCNVYDNTIGSNAPSTVAKVIVESATPAPLITITTQPQDTAAEVLDGVLTSGGVLTIAASVTPSGTPVYTWYQRLGASPDPTKDTQVGTGASFTVPPTLTMSGEYYYYCVVSAQGAQSVISAVAKVTVYIAISDPSIEIVTQPAAETVVTEGAISGSLYVEARPIGNVVPSYQWYSNASASNSGGTLIPGAVTDTFTIPATLTAAGSPYYYYCHVTGGIGSETSTVAKVTVNAPVSQVTYAEAFPDTNFRNFVLEIIGGGKTGGSLITSGDEAVLAGFMTLSVSYRNIRDLTGIKYFSELTTLDCSGNPLAALDVSHNTKLTKLYCQYTDSLATLNVSGAVLLTELVCHSGILTELDVTHNKALVSLSAGPNMLRTLDLSQNTELTYLYCPVNALKALDLTNNTKLTFLECWDNPLTALDVRQNSALVQIISGCMYIEGQVTSLDVTQNSALETLECWGYKLTTLDVSKNSKLVRLHCGGNLITALDISKNSELQTLLCGDNKLSGLDLTQNIRLTNLYCAGNQLTALDVTKNPALTLLSCAGNQLAELDVSANTALANLWCENNKLQKLDVTKNTKLEQLYCSENQLTALDVSANTALDWLICRDNAISGLDASKCLLLRRLYCQNNQLTSLSLPKNDILEWLQCQSNKLTSLNVQDNTNLDRIDCWDNQLTGLDVTKNSKLTFLLCYDNYMPSPDAVPGVQALGLVINSPANLESGSFRYYNQKTPAPVISITMQPQDTSANIIDGVLTSGGVLAAAATVTPSGTPVYTWYQRLGASPDPTKDTQVGTGASFTVPPTLTLSEYYYYCVVSAQGAQSVISAVAKVTVNTATSDPSVEIVTQPAAETVVTEGAISGSLYVEARPLGNVVPAYQWYSNASASNSGGTLIPGARTATFTIPANLTAAGSPYYYYCHVTGGIGSEISTVAKVTVNAPVTAYDYRVYLTSGQTALKAGDTLSVDVMLTGNRNYTSMVADIAYDTALLEFTGYENLSGFITACAPLAPNKASVRSIPCLDMVRGASLPPDVRIVTLKFKVKNTFTGTSVNTELSIALAQVNSPAGYIGGITAGGSNLALTLTK